MESLKWFDLNKLVSINNHQKIDTDTAIPACIQDLFLYNPGFSEGRKNNGPGHQATFSTKVLLYWDDLLLTVA